MRLSKHSKLLLIEAGAAAKIRIEAECLARGLKLTAQRRLTIDVISEAEDHPDFAELYRRVRKRNGRVSRATVYKMLKLLVSEGLIEHHSFRHGRSCYERGSGRHHDHLIDIKNGEIHEFFDPEIERLQEQIAQGFGLKLVGHRLELYAMPLRRITVRGRF